MTRRDNILDELKTLNSSLTSLALPWSVPADYFEGLAETVLARIRAIESGETEYLPSQISGLKNETPFEVPTGYFDTLADRMLAAVKSDGLSAGDELAGLSTLLSGMKKEMPYEVPANYFRTVSIPAQQSQAKVIPMYKRKTFRYAVAAMVAGLVITVGLLIGIGKSNPEKSIAIFEQKIEKEIDKTSDKELDEFLQQFSDAGLTGEEKASNNPASNEADELLKDVPEDELKEFLEETAASEAAINNETLFMN